MAMNENISFDATVLTNEETGEFELLICKTFKHGISGPHGSYPMEIDSRFSWNDISDAALKTANAAGYIVSSKWEPAGFAGIMTADVGLAIWS